MRSRKFFIYGVREYSYISGSDSLERNKIMINNDDRKTEDYCKSRMCD